MNSENDLKNSDQQVSITLSEVEKRSLLAIARDSIASKLEEDENRSPVKSGELQAPGGAFVTLHEEGKLRGCIGTLSGPVPLHETIFELARSAAFRDPRFPSLSSSELERIEIEISVLSPMHRMVSEKEIEIGQHGLYIIKGSHSGVLLPQVAVEQGWDRRTFLTHCCYKAGLDGQAWKDRDVDLFLFTALIFSE